MEITWLGVLLLPLGVMFFILAPKWLQVLTVFSIPFTATSLLNTHSGVPLSPFQFFGLLFIARQSFSSRTGRVTKVSCEDHSQLLLILFLGVVVLSMIMPVIIDGGLLVSSNQLNDLYEEPLRLTAQNIKYPIPVIFGAILSICLVSVNDTAEKIRSTIKVYVLAGVFVSLWGYFQFLCNSFFHVEYPFYLFNNAVTESMRGYAWQVEVGGDLYSRISSVTHEASIFSKYLLTVLPIVLVSVWLRRPLFSIARDRFVLVILTGVLILTTSATAYLGIICVLLVTAILLGRLHVIGWPWAIYAGLFSIICLTLYKELPVFQDFVDALLLMKHESGSALERALSMLTSWEYFRQYPILGVGWAMVTSHNLITFLLVSTGVVGFAAFFTLIFYVVRRSLQTLSKFDPNAPDRDSGVSVLVAGLVVGLITLVVMGVLTGLEFYLGYFYFILSMLIALNIAGRPKLGQNQFDASWKMIRNMKMS
jgi:hypothetical protein